MVKTLTLKNIDIYSIANMLADAFSANDNDTHLPIKINFFLQKNMAKMIELGQELDRERTEIVKRYGTLNEETQQYEIPQEKLEEAQNELNELFNLEQEVKITMLDINAFDGVDISDKKGNAIMFMIYDPDEDNEVKE